MEHCVHAMLSVVSLAVATQESVHARQELHTELNNRTKESDFKHTTGQRWEVVLRLSSVAFAIFRMRLHFCMY